MSTPHKVMSQKGTRSGEHNADNTEFPFRRHFFVSVNHRASFVVEARSCGFWPLVHRLKLPSPFDLSELLQSCGRLEVTVRTWLRWNETWLTIWSSPGCADFIWLPLIWWVIKEFLFCAKRTLLPSNVITCGFFVRLPVFFYSYHEGELVLNFPVKCARRPWRSVLYVWETWPLTG